MYLIMAQPLVKLGDNDEKSMRTQAVPKEDSSVSEGEKTVVLSVLPAEISEETSGRVEGILEKSYLLTPERRVVFDRVYRKIQDLFMKVCNYTQDNIVLELDGGEENELLSNIFGSAEMKNVVDSIENPDVRKDMLVFLGFINRASFSGERQVKFEKVDKLMWLGRAFYKYNEEQGKVMQLEQERESKDFLKRIDESMMFAFPYSENFGDLIDRSKVKAPGTKISITFKDKIFVLDDGQIKVYPESPYFELGKLEKALNSEQMDDYSKRYYQGRDFSVPEIEMVFADAGVKYQNFFPSAVAKAGQEEALKAELDRLGKEFDGLLRK